MVPGRGKGILIPLDSKKAADTRQKAFEILVSTMENDRRDMNG